VSPLVKFCCHRGLLRSKEREEMPVLAKPNVMTAGRSSF
jgi:hypothetical protein